jgi:hypothetical protein
MVVVVVVVVESGCYVSHHAGRESNAHHRPAQHLGRYSCKSFPNVFLWCALNRDARFPMRDSRLSALWRYIQYLHMYLLISRMYE